MSLRFCAKNPSAFVALAALMMFVAPAIAGNGKTIASR